MSGIGRGRGWLNINKNANTKPGLQSPVEDTTNYECKATVTPPLPTGMKYSNILSSISSINENDDGILLNQKLKHIIEQFTKDCTNPKEVEEAFDALYEHCFVDEEFASKAILMASAQSFKMIYVQGIRIRNLFIAQFQKDFEGSKQIQLNNPKYFRAVVKMLGEFYHKAKLDNGQPYRVFSLPVLKYLNMLLEATDEEDHQLFTTLLHMNGNNIRDKLPSKLMDLLTRVRHVLAYNDKLSSTSKLWLMMAIDISNTRFNFLPNEIHAYYLAHLGEDAVKEIKKISTELCIQTNYDASLDSIQSNVNVLQQVCTASEYWDLPSSTSLESEKPPAMPNNVTTHVKNPVKNFKPESGMNNIGTWEQPKNEKTPRPILGAGVRMKQDKPEEDWKERKNDEWKENSGWGDNKKKNPAGWGTSDTNKPKKNVPKGWEHDDRFNNEYN